MASPITLSAAPFQMPGRRIVPGALARPIQVHPIARFAFWSLFLLTLTNALGLLIVYLKVIYGEQFELGVYPITFAIAASLVLVFSRGRYSSVILIASWAYWLVYFLGGFLGTEQITVSDFRQTLQITIKPWMTIVGLPWLAVRAISLEKCPRLFRATVLVAAVGAVLSYVQVFVPDFMKYLNAESGRGSGFWQNPNSGGVMCALALFLSFIHPFKSRGVNWTLRMLLVVGVAFSFSRSAILVLFVGWIVYGVTAGKFRTLVASLLAFAICMGSMFVVLNSIEAISPHHATRLKHVRMFLSGDWSDSDADNRTELWRMSFERIVDEGALIFGVGHGAMARAAGGWAPHNTYLYVLGNSGILALFALLFWNFVLAQQGWQCTRRETRAALLAIAAIIATVHMFDSSFLGQPFTGVIFACFALAVCHGRGKTKSLGPTKPLPVAGTRLRVC